MKPNAMRMGSLVLGLGLLVGCGGADYARTAAAPMPASEPAATEAASPAPVALAMAAPGADVAASTATGAPVTAETGPVVVRSAPRPAPGQLTAGVWDDNLNFGFFGPYAADFRQGHEQQLALFDATSAQRAHDAFARRTAHTDLDVQLVLDTTGSMGDELSYLQSELDSIASTVRAKFPNVTPRWSLVLYRDQGDDYVTRQFDFTTDVARFQQNLRAQSAGGGGDTPEAVTAAFGVGLKQGWRAQQKQVAKVAFWVADAPTHDHETPEFARLVRDATAKGVHVYPIASSGVDGLAEYEMRTAAQQTGGRYIFLTDDSGIGNGHAEPHIPCYTVSKLDSVLVRMIESELTGDHVRARPQDVVRTVGSPNAEGQCQLQSKAVVASY